MGTQPDPAYSKAAAEAAKAAAAARQLQQQQAAQAEAADAAAAAVRKPRWSSGAIKEEPMVIDMNSAAAAALDLPPAALKYLQQQVSQQQDAVTLQQQPDQQQPVLQVKVEQLAQQARHLGGMQGNSNPSRSDGVPGMQLHHLQGQLGGPQSNPAIAEAAAALRANHAATQQPAVDLGAAAAAGVLQAALQLLQQQAGGPAAAASSGLVAALRSSPALLTALAAAATSQAAVAVNRLVGNGLQQSSNPPVSCLAAPSLAVGLTAEGKAAEQGASLHINGLSGVSSQLQAATSVPAVQNMAVSEPVVQPAAQPVGQQYAVHALQDGELKAAAAALEASTPPVAGEQRGQSPPANSQHAVAAAALAALAAAVRTGTPPADVQQAAAAALQAITVANGGASKGNSRTATPPAVEGPQAASEAVLLQLPNSSSLQPQ